MFKSLYTVLFRYLFYCYEYIQLSSYFKGYCSLFKDAELSSGSETDNEAEDGENEEEEEVPGALGQLPRH